jgi:hypothetical protein
MISRLRTFLAFEAAAFGAAALTHFGVLFDGYKHHEAAIAESLIALVLVAGLTTSLARPELTRDAALGAQGFALVLTCVGIFTIIVGVGPRTVGDVVYHIGIVGVLIWGLLTAWSASEPRRPFPV